MYPLNQKSIRGRLHQQACERVSIPVDMDLRPVPITWHFYNIAVQDLAVERIVQLEEALKQIVLDAADALEPDKDREGLADALRQLMRRAHAANVGNTITRQPDDG